MSSPTTSHADLYALAYSWSSRINGVFRLLEAVEKTLSSSTPNMDALPVLRTAMDQISDCDDEGELLNTLWRLTQPAH